MSETLYTIMPPVVSVTIRTANDTMVAGNAARHVAGLVGFATMYQAEAAGAATEIANLVLKSGKPHEFNVNGIQKGVQTGMQMSCAVAWAANADANAVKQGLAAKLGSLVDEIALPIEDDVPIIALTLWLHPDRRRRAVSRG